MAEKKVRIRLVRSQIKTKPKTRRNIHALGLRRINSEVVHVDTPQIRGMIRMVEHLVEVEEFEE